MIRPLIRFRFLLLVLFLTVFTLLAQDAGKGWTPESMIKIKRVGGTSISPDGKLIAYTVSAPQMEGEKSEFLTHIWVVSPDGTMNSQFTYGDKSCTNPVFSPDGTMLTFLSSRGTSGKNEVWVMKLSGGEAEHECQSGREHLCLVAGLETYSLYDERFRN